MQELQGLPPPERTPAPVDAGGVAGGLKFIHGGAFFKFAVDEGLFRGHDELAAMAPHRAREGRPYHKLARPPLTCGGAAPCMGSPRGSPCARLAPGEARLLCRMPSTGRPAVGPAMLPAMPPIGYDWLAGWLAVRLTANAADLWPCW